LEVNGSSQDMAVRHQDSRAVLNAFEPVIANSILQSIAWMTNAFRTLRVNCVGGITASTAHLTQQVEMSVGVVTALIPYLG
jgi:aspartate ammonia-lyase